MKIGLVSPYVYPLPGGVTQHVRYLYENLRLRGHDVRILTSSHGLQRTSEGDVIRLGKGFSMPANGSVGTITVSPRYVSQVRELLERERFDVLHFHEPFVPFLSLVILRESKSVNIGTFHAYGGWSPAYEFGSPGDEGLRRAAPRPDRRLGGRAPLHRPLLPGRLQGDPQRRGRGPLPARRARSPAGRTGRANILFVGRFEPRKGVLDLLQAYRILRKTGCECRLLLVGGGPQEREARRYIATRRLHGVEFLGRVSDDEKAQLFRTADVFVSPATGRESFGIVLLEAMAAGAPIVASDIHGYKGVVRRDREALLVPPRQPKAIAASIARLLREPETAAAMSAAGSRRAEEFSWPRVTAKVEDYYGFAIRRLAAAGPLPAALHGRRAALARGSAARSVPIDAPPSTRRADRRAAGSQAAPGAPSGPPASPAAGSSSSDQRHPPHPGRVGDDRAGDDEEHDQDHEPRVRERDRAAPVQRVDRELERVQVGRAAGPGRRSRSSTAAAAPRCSGTGPRTTRRPPARTPRRTGGSRAR